MNKVKAAVLVILAVVLIAFAVENAQPSPVIKLFKFQLGELPTYLLVYVSLAAGIIIGWVAHALRLRQKQQEVQEAASTQQQQEPQ
jgi:uncharacterized integral membrane protein